jgi:hypothetical protein
MSHLVGSRDLDVLHTLALRLMGRGFVQTLEGYGIPIDHIGGAFPLKLEC